MGKTAMKILHSEIGNKELLEMYGYEPYNETTVAARWERLTRNWNRATSSELGHLRQVMLQIHLDCDPDDERWR